MASKKHLQTVEEKATKTHANQPPLPTTEVQPGKPAGDRNPCHHPLPIAGAFADLLQLCEPQSVITFEALFGEDGLDTIGKVSWGAPFAC